MPFMRDGSPISSNFIDHYNISNGGKTSCFEIHIATIQAVLYADDIENMSGHVEYVIKIESGGRRGQIYSHVRAQDIFGGQVNFSEIVYQPKENTFKGPESPNTSSEKGVSTITTKESDASQVLVMFLDGSYNAPMIVSGWSHSNNLALHAKKSDGVRILQEFNGIRTEINKNGEYILTYWGGKRNSKTKKTTNPSTSPTIMKIDKTGAFSISDKQKQRILISQQDNIIKFEQCEGTMPSEEYPQYGQKAKTYPEQTFTFINKIEMNKVSKSLIISMGNDTVLNTIDGKNEKQTIVFKSGLIIELNGNSDKVNITTSGGAFLDIDGASDIITAKTNAGRQVQITNSKQILGSGTEHIILGDTLKQLMDTLCSTIIAGVVPGGPGQNAASLLQIKQAFTSLQSQLTTILSQKSYTD